MLFKCVKCPESSFPYYCIQKACWEATHPREESNIKSCHNCGKDLRENGFSEGPSTSLRSNKARFCRCPQCKCTYYCSRACQVDNWRQSHFQVCSALIKAHRKNKHRRVLLPGRLRTSLPSDQKQQNPSREEENNLLANTYINDDEKNMHQNWKRLKKCALQKGTSKAIIKRMRTSMKQNLKAQLIRRRSSVSSTLSESAPESTGMSGTDYTATDVSATEGSATEVSMTDASAPELGSPLPPPAAPPSPAPPTSVLSSSQTNKINPNSGSFLRNSKHKQFSLSSGLRKKVKSRSRSKSKSSSRSQSKHSSSAQHLMHQRFSMTARDLSSVSTIITALKGKKSSSDVMAQHQAKAGPSTIKRSSIHKAPTFVVSAKESSDVYENNSRSSLSYTREVVFSLADLGNACKYLMFLQAYQLIFDTLGELIAALKALRKGREEVE